MSMMSAALLLIGVLAIAVAIALGVVTKRPAPSLIGRDFAQQAFINRSPFAEKARQFHQVGEKVIYPTRKGNRRVGDVVAYRNGVAGLQYGLKRPRHSGVFFRERDLVQPRRFA